MCGGGLEAEPVLETGTAKGMKAVEKGKRLIQKLCADLERRCRWVRQLRI